MWTYELATAFALFLLHVCVTVNMQRELIRVRQGVVTDTITVDASLCSR